MMCIENTRVPAGSQPGPFFFTEDQIAHRPIPLPRIELMSGNLATQAGISTITWSVFDNLPRIM